MEVDDGQEVKWSRFVKMEVCTTTVVGIYVVVVLSVLAFALLSGMNINYTVSGEINREAPAKVENSYGAQLHTDER